MSLMLAVVIVLASTPAVLAGQLSDPTHPISRVGSQLRRIAAAMPVRLASRPVKRDTHRPVACVLTLRHLAPPVGSIVKGDGMRGAGPPIARLPLHCVDLPPPAHV